MKSINKLEVSKLDFQMKISTYEYIDGAKLFVHKYSSIPDIIILYDIDPRVAYHHINTALQSMTIEIHKQQVFSINANSADIGTFIFVLESNIIIELNRSYVAILYTKAFFSKVEGIFKDFKKLKVKRKKTNEIGVIVSVVSGSFRIRDVKCESPQKFSISQNYNNDFEEVQKGIIKQLKMNRAGIHLLYGVPGTGKSTFIRYLVSRVPKQFIFLTPKMAGNLDNPELFNLLIETPNSILVIEDSEDLILSREHGGNSAVSTLLSISSGVLEQLGIQTICTFNTQHLHHIDKALLRKGRLLSMYEFKELSVEKSNALLRKKGHEKIVNIPMTLADIYYPSDENSSNVPFKMKENIGFRQEAFTEA